MALCFFWGIMRLPLAEAIALSFIAPLIALYLASLLLKERIGKHAIIASLLGLAGVGVIVAARMQGGYGVEALGGAGAILFSAVLFAWNLVLQRQQAQLASPVEVAFFQHLVMLVIFSVAAPFLAIVPPGHAIPLVLLSAGLAFTSLAALAWAYARAEAQRLIPVEYSAFIWAALAGWLAFGEALAASTLVGAVLIIAGCLIAARSSPDLPPHVESGLA
jgi:S-adenosylmethionine uptake transporter